MQAPSAITLHESELAKFLFRGFQARDLIATELDFMPQWSPMFEIPTKDLVRDVRGPGDIDVLVLNGARPERAIAFELKRIKVSAASFDTGLPGKIQGLKDGVHRSNLLHKLGFYRTYLLVTVVTDGRERMGANFAFRGPASELVRIIDDFPARDTLNRHVGLVFIELTQPVDKEIELAGAIGIRIVRHPAEVKQPPTLTNAIRELLRHSHAASGSKLTEN